MESLLRSGWIVGDTETAAQPFCFVPNVGVVSTSPNESAILQVRWARQENQRSKGLRIAHVVMHQRL
jgi:hypothetical protein